MNEIEEKFLLAYKKRKTWVGIRPQVAIGIYRVDFYLDDLQIAIEIDGYEFHKTKEQREKDYCRERYLMRSGNVVVRFTATEVFMDADKCASELLEIIDAEITRRNHYIIAGMLRSKRISKKNPTGEKQLE